MKSLDRPTEGPEFRVLGVDASKKAMPWIWSAWLLAPVGFMSEMMKFTIGYIAAWHGGHMLLHALELKALSAYWI